MTYRILRIAVVLTAGLGAAAAQTPGFEISLNASPVLPETSWTWTSTSPSASAPQSLAAFRIAAEPGSWAMVVGKVWVDPVVAGNQQAAQTMLERYASMRRVVDPGSAYAGIASNIDAASLASLTAAPAGAVRLPVAKVLGETAEIVGLSLADPQQNGVRGYAQAVLAGQSSVTWDGEYPLWGDYGRRAPRPASTSDWSPHIPTIELARNAKVINLQSYLVSLLKAQALANSFTESNWTRFATTCRAYRIDLQVMVFDGLAGQSATISPWTTPGLAVLAQTPPQKPRLRFTVPLTVTVQVPTTLGDPEPLAVVRNPAPDIGILYGGLGEAGRAFVYAPEASGGFTSLKAVFIGLTYARVSDAWVEYQYETGLTVVDFVIPYDAPAGSLFFVDEADPMTPLAIPSEYSYLGGYLFLPVAPGIISPYDPWIPL